ncbi:MAG: ribosomal protein [Betaproteobacteria bacterium]|jgi:large subunit ribosomal protein L9|nr:ribosomal protein [Betaproteobacteria bacterium]
MQIILLEKVTNLGSLGDVVKVRDGFARNFLIPQGKAKRATRENLAQFEQRRAELEKAQAQQLNEAQDRAVKLEGLAVQIAQKAGVDGKLFGSVTNADIADALKQQGFEVPKAAVRMPQGPLKNIGEHPLKVALHTDVVVTVTVTVVAEP